jgi:hypothetical protein
MCIDSVSPVKTARWLRPTLYACFLALTLPASGFDVIKNVNSGKPPIEKVVLFEKGKPHDHLSFVDDENCKLSYAADGAIECRIQGSAEIKPLLKWKETDGIPAGIRLQDYDYVIITCRLEGTVHTTNPNGKVTDTRPDNLWYGFSLYDANGEILGGCSFADPTEDKRTPDKTAVLKFPMMMVRIWHPENDGALAAIGFPWSKTRPTSNRDFKLVVDKISLAVEPK